MLGIACVLVALISLGLAQSGILRFKPAAAQARSDTR
jgi:hypothetical protein